MEQHLRPQNNLKFVCVYICKRGDWSGTGMPSMLIDRAVSFSMFSICSTYTMLYKGSDQQIGYPLAWQCLDLHKLPFLSFTHTHSHIVLTDSGALIRSNYDIKLLQNVPIYHFYLRTTSWASRYSSTFRASGPAGLCKSGTSSPESLVTLLGPLVMEVSLQLVLVAACSWIWSGEKSLLGPFWTDVCQQLDTTSLWNDGSASRSSCWCRPWAWLWPSQSRTAWHPEALGCRRGLVLEEWCQLFPLALPRWRSRGRACPRPWPRTSNPQWPAQKGATLKFNQVCGIAFNFLSTTTTSLSEDVKTFPSQNVMTWDDQEKLKWWEITFISMGKAK